MVVQSSMIMKKIWGRGQNFPFQGVIGEFGKQGSSKVNLRLSPRAPNRVEPPIVDTPQEDNL